MFLFSWYRVIKNLFAPDNYSTKKTQKFSILNSFDHLPWTVLYWTQSSRTQFGMSVNVWRLVGDILNITWYFLYCNHQVHRDFLITLCVQTRQSQTFCNELLAVGCWAVNFSLKKAWCSKIVHVVPDGDRSFVSTQATESDVICSSECWYFIENSIKGIRTVLRELEQY